MTLYEEEELIFKIEAKLMNLRSRELKGMSRKLINMEGTQLYKDAMTIPCLLSRENVLYQYNGKLLKYSTIEDSIKLHQDVLEEYKDY